MAFVIGGTAGAIIGAGALTAGAGIASGAMGASAAGDAADKQAAAANYASDLQKQMFEEQRTDSQPWRKAGETALGGLSNFDGHSFGNDDFTKDPGYDFRLAEGQKALERSAAAKGGLFSGATGKAMSRYGQDYASNEYQNAYSRFTNDQTNRFNRLAAVAGVGQQANAQIGQAGQNYANQVGQNAMGAANAQGAAGIASANAWGQGLQGVAGVGKNWMDYTMAKQLLGK